MPLQFYNTLTRRKEPFQPLAPGKASMYVCGVTVYDHCHVGHARGAVVFDVLRRWLEQAGYRVAHARNVTDVDDKIIQRAREEGGELKAAAAAVARRYEASFRDDFGKLGLLPPSQEPRATEYIPKMVAFIGKLIEAGYAYPAADGVYFSVNKLRDYGKLSHQKPDQMLEGVRISAAGGPANVGGGDPGEGKKEPLDFALWKKTKPEEPAWDSPWGPGRPGWHIECSTMSTDILGDAFDIHGGGQDLIFPHHENELAQSSGAGKPFARVWLHNGLLTVNGQKMSKSVGNIIPISEVLKRHSADVLRVFFLGAHYRSPVDFTWERLDEAARGYETLAAFIAHAQAAPGDGKDGAVEGIESRFRAAMEDDLNTPEALAALHALRGAASHGTLSLAAAAAAVQRLGRVLGLFQAAGGLDAEVQQMVRERDEARRRKDFATSDRIREQLSKMGYAVEDTSGRTVVRKRV